MFTKKLEKNLVDLIFSTALQWRTYCDEKVKTLRRHLEYDLKHAIKYVGSKHTVEVIGNCEYSRQISLEQRLDSIEKRLDLLMDFLNAEEVSTPANTVLKKKGAK